MKRKLFSGASLLSGASLAVICAASSIFVTAPVIASEISMIPAISAIQSKDKLPADVTVPRFLERARNDLTYVGKVGGLNAWTITDGPMFLASPDNKFVILGLAIDSEKGVDVTPNYSGAAPVDAAKLLDAISTSGKAKAGALAAPTSPAGSPSALPASPASSAQATARPLVPAASSKPVEAPVEAPVVTVAPAVKTSATNPLLADNVDTSLIDSIANQTKWISIGSPRSDAPVIYMISDPDCIHCAASFSRLREAVEARRVQVRVILTPILSPDSLNYAAAILESSDPAQALWDHELSYASSGHSSIKPVPYQAEFVGVQQQDGKIVAAKHPELLEMLKANVSWAKAHNVQGTPYFVWKAVNDGKTEIHSSFGELQDLNDFVGIQSDSRDIRGIHALEGNSAR